MKHLLSSLVLLLALAMTSVMTAQEVKVVTYTLDNGLKVVLAEEHSQPQIFGGLLVHAGSKNEDPNITGVAHYFEHMMFKGTDRIGTIDWPHESLYLDSISHQYDLLHATNDANQRKAIQKEINRLNIAASKYAIPNEVDAILSRIGSTGLNAGTSYDYTVFYNTFPSNQIENWMDIYLERFRYPVFRLFQSELEAVYEEKNMYEDSPIFGFQRQMFQECFGEHPYSRDVIGLGEHLKNPQPSEMRRFFNTYYVANNMTLVMVGDFNIKEVKPLIAKKFSSMRTGVLPQKKQYKLPTFDSQVVKDVRLTPIPMGMIVFKGVPANHPDELPLSVLNQILSGGTGIMDRATSEGKIMMASQMSASLEDAGINLIMYVPNLMVQSHEKAEKVVWDCIDSVKNGNFSDDLLEAIKTSARIEREKSVETLEGLAELIQQLAMTGSSYEQWMADNERLQKITKQDIIDLANKYLDPDHCTIVRSKIGSAPKDVVDKPDWDHLNAQNIGTQSAFATEIYSRPIKSVEPQKLIFGKDVAITPINSHYTLYSNPNPKNDIFSLSINYNYGAMDDVDLDRAATYFNAIGAGDKDLTAFNLQLQLLGASMTTSVSDDHTTIEIEGLEKNLDQILALVRYKFDNPRHDAKQISQIVDMVKAGEKSAKDDASTWFDALRSYVMYGANSEFLRSTPVKQWKEHTGEELMSELDKMFGYAGYITFAGNTDAKHLIAALQQNHFVADQAVDQPVRAYKRQIPTNNQVFYATNKKFGQSNIAILAPGLEVAPEDRAAMNVFNEYYGAGSMNSIIFQEIREFRSLGYTTYGIYTTDDRHINNGMLLTYLGTQCDKTNDGIDALTDLMDNVPIQPDKFNIAREFKVLERNGDYCNFRDRASQVRYWREVCGYDHDIRAEVTERIPSLTLDDLKAFIDKYVANRPKTIVISGNAKRFSVKDLEKYGKVTKLKSDQIMKF